MSKPFSPRLIPSIIKQCLGTSNEKIRVVVTMLTVEVLGKIKILTVVMAGAGGGGDGCDDCVKR